jgi:hypothetical protein
LQDKVLACAKLDFSLYFSCGGSQGSVGSPSRKIGNVSQAEIGKEGFASKQEFIDCFGDRYDPGLVVVVYEFEVCT